MRGRLLWAGLLVLVAVVYLAYAGWQGAATYYVTPSEARGGSFGRSFRLAGNVAPGVTWDGASMLLQFEVTDGVATVPVVYRGAPPDNFAAGQQVVVEGTVDGQGRVVASRLIMKCPSKYEQATRSGNAAGRRGVYLGGAALAGAVGLAVAASRRLAGTHPGWPDNQRKGR